MIGAAYPLVLPALTLVLGMAFGMLHFNSLKAVTRLYVSGKSLGTALAIQLLRMIVAVAVFACFAFAGATTLLTGTLGFLLGRAIVLRRTGKEL